MRLNGTVYECVDGRTGVRSISGVSRLFSIPGGFEVQGLGAPGEQFLDVESSDLEDNEAQGSIVIHRPEGALHFVKLTLEDFNRHDGPTYFDTPDFRSTAALQNFFWHRLITDDRL